VSGTPDEKALLQILAVELGRRTVREEDRLIEDLEAESMDLVAVLAAVEERWGLELDEAEISGVRTVRDLVERILQAAGT